MQRSRTISRYASVVALSMFLAVPMFADGAAVYKAKCKSCHGADGSPSAFAQKMGAMDLGSPEVQKKSDAELTKIITDGEKKMPAYASKLSSDEIKSVVEFIRTLKK